MSKFKIVSEVITESYPILSRLARILELANNVAQGMAVGQMAAQETAEKAFESLQQSIENMDNLEQVLSQPPYSNTGVGNPKNTKQDKKIDQKGKKRGAA